MELGPLPLYTITTTITAITTRKTSKRASLALSILRVRVLLNLRIY